MVRKAWDCEKSVPGAPIVPTTWGVLQLVLSLNVAIALVVPLRFLGNLIKYFDDYNAYHSRFSKSKWFWSVAVGIPSR